MASTKRLNGSYTLATINATDTVTLSTSLVTITGNLVVLGSTAAIESTNTNIWDNIVTLNAGLSPGIAPTLNAGIEVDRGTQSNVRVMWNESTLRWQITNDGSTYGNIATSTGTGTAITSVSQDTAPALGGNLDVKTWQIYSSTTPAIYLNDNVAIATTSVAPTAITNNVVMYASTVAGGGSGIYTASTGGNNELATKSAAIKYSIIFG